MFAEAARFYISLGWKVFPLVQRGKVPTIKGGYQIATDDPAIIAAWARQFPHANIAIATGKVSGIIVIDIDKRNGGFATLAKLAGVGFVFPLCPEAKTGNGGRHLFFAYRGNIESGKNKLGPGIDVQSDKRYIVGVPSWIGESDQGPGGSYEWLNKPTSTPPALPYWVVEKLKPKPIARPQFEPRMTHEMAERSLEGMARRLAGASAGSRNELLNWCAFHAGQLVRERKIGSSVVEARLTQAALAAGLPLPEIRKTIQSGLFGALK
jgi:hypothetical protein